MDTSNQVKEATEKAKLAYAKLEITKEDEEAVLKYLADIGAIFLCGTATGCDGSCPPGQTCERTFMGNCVCRK